jgi:serine/threonine-protein kinase HipA
MTNAKVVLWGTDVGAVTWSDEQKVGYFQYFESFVESDIEVSPIMMPLRVDPYVFPNLSREAFRGLPGLLADSLPDKFGNAIIDSWIATEGINPENFSSVDRLCCIGSRGMGGLEFKPAIFERSTTTKKIEISKLVDLSNQILNKRAGLSGVFLGKDDREALKDILRVGTSAGGARAKAILAWNPKTNEFRSGQITAPDGFQYWILKFDGVSDKFEYEIADPQGYGKIEFAYSRMAKEAGIKMMPCRLHNEGGRSHFMTKRFDRNDDGSKIHMQSLGAMVHSDYKQPANYSYEQAIQLMQHLQLPKEDLEQQVLRAMFNVVGRNQDDHVKNIAFIMDRNGEWRLSPAYDMSYSFNPFGEWTNGHQMTINNKNDGFTRKDISSFAEVAGIKSSKAYEMLDFVILAIKRWRDIAEEEEVSEDRISQIQANLRLEI